MAADAETASFQHADKSRFLKLTLQLLFEPNNLYFFPLKKTERDHFLLCCCVCLQSVWVLSIKASFKRWRLSLFMSTCVPARDRTVWIRVMGISRNLSLFWDQPVIGFYVEGTAKFLGDSFQLYPQLGQKSFSLVW